MWIPANRGRGKGFCGCSICHGGCLSISMPVFKSMVHAFVCSIIDYCNSLLIGLLKSRLAPLQSVLNAAARLISRIPPFSHISTFTTEQLHWLPLSAQSIHQSISFYFLI